MAITNRQHLTKSRDYFANKVHLSLSVVFSIWSCMDMSWTTAKNCLFACGVGRRHEIKEVNQSIRKSILRQQKTDAETSSQYWPPEWKNSLIEEDLDAEDWRGGRGRQVRWWIISGMMDMSLVSSRLIGNEQRSLSVVQSWKLCRSQTWRLRLMNWTLTRQRLKLLYQFLVSGGLGVCSRYQLIFIIIVLLWESSSVAYSCGQPRYRQVPLRMVWPWRLHPNTVVVIVR